MLKENTIGQILKVIGAAVIMIGLLSGFILIANDTALLGFVSIISSVIFGFVIVGLSEIIRLLDETSQKKDNEIHFLKKIVQSLEDQKKEHTDA